MFAYTGFSLATASHGGALVHGTIPMFTALLGWFVGKVKLPRRLWYGLLLIQLGIAAVLLDAGYAGTWPQGMGDLFLLMAGLCWAAYGLLYTRAVALLGASTTALFTAAVPCITALAGIWLLDEIPSPMVWTGIACVTAGMMVAMYFGKPAARKPVHKQAPAKPHST